MIPSTEEDCSETSPGSASDEMAEPPELLDGSSSPPPAPESPAMTITPITLAMDERGDDRQQVVANSDQGSLPTAEGAGGNRCATRVSSLQRPGRIGSGLGVPQEGLEIRHRRPPGAWSWRGWRSVPALEHADAEHLGDLGVGQIGVELERDHLAVARRPAWPAPRGRRRGRAAGLRPPRRDRARGRVDRAAWVVNSALAPAQLIQRRVADDPEQPRARGAAAGVEA